MEDKISIKVLFVDDSPEDRELYSRYLGLLKTKYDLLLDEAGSAEEALEKLKATKYDLLLVDYNLPSLSGLEFIDLLKKDLEDYNPEFIALTGEGNEQAAVEFMKRGAADYLVKALITEDSLLSSAQKSIDRLVLKEQLHLSEAKLLDLTEELRRSNKELETFAHMASHDMREPLRKINSFSERLITKFGPELPEKAREYVEKMDNAAKRMQNLIDKLLQFSRVGSSNNIELEAQDLNEIIETVKGDLSGAIKKANASVEIEGKLPTILADKVLISELFQNLIANAIKFSKPDENPLVKIQSKAIERFYEIVVSDNGIGFDQEHADRIFEQFNRLHGKNEYEGSGMGLAICKKIVNSHGGFIKAESKLGQGARFIVKLPKS